MLRHNDIFEIEIITFSWDMDFQHPYPAFNIRSSGRCFCQSFGEAEDRIAELGGKTSEKIYRLILRRLPFAERLYRDEFIKLGVYDSKGELLDRSLCSNCQGFERQNQFHGRPEQLIRFRQGDIVECFNGEKARLGIVTAVPPTPEECDEIGERVRKRHPGLRPDWCLDWTDDAYTIIDSPDFIASHEHVFSPFVARPAFPVPEKLRKYLEEAWRHVNCGD